MVHGRWKYLIVIGIVSISFWTKLPPNSHKADALLFILYVFFYTTPLILLLTVWDVIRHRASTPHEISTPTRPIRDIVTVSTVSALLLFTARYFLVSPPCSVKNIALVDKDYSKQATGRIFLLAVDGVDPLVLESLKKQGVVPELARFLEQGAFASLTTISRHSPVIWTSIITGMPPEQHGIVDYTTSYIKGTSIQLPSFGFDILDRVVLKPFSLRSTSGVSSNNRRVQALWEILSQFNVSSRFVNWWGSFPVDEVKGEIVSSQIIPWETLSKADLVDTLTTSRILFPDHLKEKLLPLILQWGAELKNDKIIRDARSIEGNAYYRHRDDLMFRIFLNRLDDGTQPAQVNAVYLQGIDTASHAFTIITRGYKNHRRPLLVSQQIADKLWNELVVSSYLTLDRQIGQILERRKAEDTVIVVSDHGWRYDGTAHWEMPDGVFMALGPSIRPGHGSAHVFDILPTIMHLLKLPLANDLPGRPLSAFLTDTRSEPQIPELQTYGCRRPFSISDYDRMQSIRAGEVKRLRGLGYLQGTS